MGSVRNNANSRTVGSHDIPPKPKPFPPNVPKSPVQLWDDQYITFTMVRSWRRDEEALKRDHRAISWVNLYPLIREDFLPFLDSYRLGFSSTYGGDDRYYVTAKYFFPDDDGKEPAKIATEFKQVLARASLSGVQGTYRVLTVTLGVDVYAAEIIDSPGGVTGAGDTIPDYDPVEMAGMIAWMDKTTESVTHVTDRFLEETLRQIDPDSEAGRALRYGILLGLQVTKDQLSAKHGAADVTRLRALALMGLGVSDVDRRVG
jgi:hypothetical protein